MDNYTIEVSERIEDLVEGEIAGIWADMDELGTGASVGQWKAKLESIAREYSMSSRTALLRLLNEKGAGLADSREPDEEEHLRCLNRLLEMAGPSPEEDPLLHERVISRAWNDENAANALMLERLPPESRDDPRRRKKAVAGIEKENHKRFAAAFTREEALQLGHILGFTLEEMQWYLMRVFDMDDGLRMNRSADLAEAYGFLTGADCRRAAELRARCREILAGVEKNDDERRAENWTRRTTGELLKYAEEWRLRPEEMDEHFLAWIRGRASGLDLPSRTAGRVYRNLAVYAYMCSVGRALIPEESELYDKLQTIIDQETDSTDTRFYLCENGVISAGKCEDVAKRLYHENKERADSESKDSTQAWSVITLRKDGELSSSYGAVNASRTRIMSLLRGEEEVEKGDLLYLLWYVLNLSWAYTPAEDPNTLCCRIFDLKDISACLLEKALLPPFYPPHLMEQSMLLSIIYGGKTGTDPTVIYDVMLRSVKGSRNRGSAGNKTE